MQDEVPAFQALYTERAHAFHAQWQRDMLALLDDPSGADISWSTHTAHKRTFAGLTQPSYMHACTASCHASYFLVVGGVGGGAGHSIHASYMPFLSGCTRVFPTHAWPMI